jgi:hypothetical protein
MSSLASSSLARCASSPRAVASARRRARRPRVVVVVVRAAGDAADDASATSDDDDDDDARRIAFMTANYRPWIKSEEDAVKCLAHIRKTEGLILNVEKAASVLASIKADHEKSTPKDVPFKLPQIYPGFLLILQRSSDEAA